MRHAVASELSDDAVARLYAGARLGRLRRSDRRRAALAASRRVDLRALLATCSYRDLQRACRRLGLAATGTAAALRRRVSIHANAPSSGHRTVAWILSEDGLAVRVRAQDLPLSIGRSRSNDVVVSDDFVSRRHCVLSEVGGRLLVADAGSKNGSLVDDARLAPGAAAELGRETVLSFGRRFLRIVNELELPRSTGRAAAGETHGVVVVDVAGSATRSLDDVSWMVDRITLVVRSVGPTDCLLFKNTGDGCVAVYGSPRRALEVASRVLRAARDAGRDALPLRVAVDAGPTYPTPDGVDRVGLPLIRVARIEKVQAADLVRPGAAAAELPPTGRIVIGEGMRDALAARDRRLCRFLGRLPLRGFGERLFRLYRLEGELPPRRGHPRS